MNRVFVRLCKEKFQFLVEDFGFQLVTTRAERDSGCVTYQNETTAIGIWVALIRLVSGQRPDYDDPLNTHGPGHLVRLRSASGWAPDEAVPRPPTPAGIENVLDEQARAVRIYAKDILHGDFAVFPMLAEMEQAMIEEFAREQGGDAAP